MHHRVLISAGYLLKSMVLGFFLSGLLVYFIAILQVNLTGFLFKINPGIAGADSRVKNITETLKRFPRPPKIYDASRDSRKISLAAALASSGPDNLFGGNILPSVPNFLIIPVGRPDASIYLMSDFLVINKFDKAGFEQISPPLAYLFVKDYFSRQAIKFYPKVNIMGRVEYENHRKVDSLEKIQKIDTALLEVRENISSYSAAIDASNEEIEFNSNSIESISSQKEIDYRKCLVERRPRKECTDEREEQNLLVTNLKNEVNDSKNLVQSNQLKLDEFKYYEDLFKAQQDVLRQSSDNLQKELGVFEPKDSIRLVFDISKPEPFTSYLLTLVHEYLHYASYKSETQKLENSFFEEGLTEYFVKQIFGKEATSNLLGYPIQVKIVSDMMIGIAEADFKNIYFDKDQDQLEKTLALVYGDDFYKDYLFTFEALQYPSNVQEIIKLTNRITNKIGGTPISEKNFIINSGIRFSE